jgi:uncharacterized lipoprotein YddW (UPF0748 family)
MKRVIFLMIVILFGALYLNYNNSSSTFDNDKDDMMKAVFISYIDYSSLKGKEVIEQKNIINEMVNNVSYFGFNTIVLQVRAFGDAIYESSYFPESIYVSYDDGKTFDILSYFISVCDSKNIDLYAWVNPYRISNTGDVSKISKSASYYKWLNTSLIGVYDNGIYFNPAEDDVKDLIVSGVVEIAKNYKVKGILFDDYFYPNDKIDRDSYNAYDGDLSLNDYRIFNVNDLLKRCYSSIKEVNNDIFFGISPSGNISNNLKNEYLDVRGILNDKYLDFIMPQLYYGFFNESKPYTKTLEEWSNLNVNNISLYVALSIYKSGMVDNYAGEGINEWINNNDIIKRQVMSSKGVKNYKGFAVFRYQYMFEIFDNDNLVKEVSGLREVIKDY